MTCPTDDELEAVAARLIHGFYTLSEAEGAMDEAAAMLRACKGRDAEKQAYIAGTQSGWDAAIDAAERTCLIVRGKRRDPIAIQAAEQCAAAVSQLKKGPRHD